jgi:hypothetical protein
MTSAAGRSAVSTVCVSKMIPRAPAKQPHTPADDREWMDLVATMMEPDDARAVTLARQIWHVGYARMRGTGLTGLRNYILPHQIAAVDEKGVHLHIDLPVPESAPQAS